MMMGKRVRIFIIGFVTLICGILVMSAEFLRAAEPVQVQPQAMDVGYLENIEAESPVAGKERLLITVSKLSGVSVESLTTNTLLVKLDNIFVPQDLRHPFAEGVLQNVVRVTPMEKIVDGHQWAYLTIDLKERVPYRVRSEGQKFLIDFNVAAEKATSVPPEASASSEQKSDKSEASRTPVEKAAVSEPAGEGSKTGLPRISIDFQDANIKSVFRLLAELANINIVAGDEVKGTVTIRMKDVPWEQALDTILSITGLGSIRNGNVITVMNSDKVKKLEAEREGVTAESLVTRVITVNYGDAKKLEKNLAELLPKDKEGKPVGSVKVDEHSNSLIIQATRQDMTRLFPIIEKIDKPTPQVLIKANIVETTKDTARNLGIQWGGMWGQKIGSQNLYVTPGGSGGLATNPAGPFEGAFNPTSGASGISGQGFGVNFPATMSGTASGSLGLIFGKIGENILEVQLNALQKDGKLNILSSPSITTLDNQKAFTENGEKVPYVTTEVGSTGSTTKSVKFENVVLRLEITPHVIDGKNLKMKILVQKDEVDTSRSVDGNPFIIKKQTETNLIVEDGETIVISGLTKQRTTENTNGVPWLKDIPVVGWLFKGQSTADTMEEVLIFITPNILKPQEVAGIQSGS